MFRICKLFAVVLAAFFGSLIMAYAGNEAGILVYYGTYSGENSQGIYASRLDPATGELTSAVLKAEAKNPSFLAIHPSRKFLYAVSEISDFGGNLTGGITAYAVDLKSGDLTLLNRQSSRGSAPCHLVVDATGKNVLVANYGGGSVTVLPIGPNGTLEPASAFVQHQGNSVDKDRQEGPHAHSVNLDPSNKFAFAADLGLDKILIYRFDSAKGLLATNSPPAGRVAPGSGPRHFAFHPSGRFAFVNNELTSNVTSFAFDPTSGSLTEIETLSTLPVISSPLLTAVPNYTAETVAHPSGQFVYVSNRGHDSIAVFAFNSATGKLKAVGHEPTGGKTPRNFAIDPSGQFLLAANQGSNSIVVFKINQETGLLIATGHSTEVGQPVCVRFLKLDN